MEVIRQDSIAPMLTVEMVEEVLEETDLLVCFGVMLLLLLQKVAHRIREALQDTIPLDMGRLVKMGNSDKVELATRLGREEAVEEAVGLVEEVADTTTGPKMMARMMMRREAVVVDLGM